MEKSQVTSSNTTKQNQRIQELELENESLRVKVAWLEGQFRLKTQKEFGASSEKLSADQLQLPLFNEVEAIVASTDEEPTEEGDKASLKKRRQRQSLNKSLPVKIVTYSLSESERTCLCCGKQIHAMKTEIRREIEIIPAQVHVTEHRQEVYACRTCEREGIETPITKAAAPNPVLPKSMASPSALAYVFVQKYQAGLPLYRIEEQFKQLEASISRQTLSNWIIAATGRWIAPLYELMRETLLDQKVLHADETSIQVLREPGKNASSDSYMWLFRTGRAGPPCVLFNYQTTRAAKHPKRFLEGFKGTLHADGYKGYDGLPGVTLSGCWAHARRYFVDAKRSAPKNIESSPTLTDEAIARIGAFYQVEKKINELEKKTGIYDPEIRLQIRQEKTLPLVTSFYAWLKTIRPQVVPKSPLGKAVTYALNQEKKLMQPFFDGCLDLDNNLAERSIKPFVIGRKNWLFSNTPKGAETSAMAYSLLVTAKENQLNVLAYLTHLFNSLPNLELTDREEVRKYLPWAAELPASCRLQTDSE